MPFPDWMSQYELCFPVASEHFGPARLRIVPEGYEKDRGGKFAPEQPDCVYGLYVTARFEDDSRGLNYSIGDFVDPEKFQMLDEFLGESTGRETSVRLEGDDGHLDLRFHRRSSGDLRLQCVSPSTAWSVNCLRLKIEGVLKAESLAGAREQMGRLMELVARINSGAMEP